MLGLLPGSNTLRQQLGLAAAAGPLFCACRRPAAVVPLPPVAVATGVLPEEPFHQSLNMPMVLWWWWV
jgi:hypothetical protein